MWRVTLAGVLQPPMCKQTFKVLLEYTDCLFVAAVLRPLLDFDARLSGGGGCGSCAWCLDIVIRVLCPSRRMTVIVSSV